jgi:hypothetical protein
MKTSINSTQQLEIELIRAWVQFTIGVSLPANSYTQEENAAYCAKYADAKLLELKNRIMSGQFNVLESFFKPTIPLPPPAPVGK